MISILGELVFEENVILGERDKSQEPRNMKFESRAKNQDSRLLE